MAKKKNYYYVLVFTPNGPVYVTDVEWSSKTAHWNKEEKPMEMAQSIAKDLAWALNVNWHNAQMVCSCYELVHQPYNYESYDIKFEKKESGENANG